VWVKVGARSCLECHKPGGDAEDSKFILEDPAKGGSVAHNREAFQKMALRARDGQSRLLLKATGKLSHGGEEVLKPDSTAFRILGEFVRRVGGAPIAAAAPDKAKPDLSHFFDGLTMIDDRRLLRRATLSLAGRLPKPEEVEAVSKNGTS